MELKRDWPDVGMEVEQSVCGGPQPLTQILGVGDGGAQSHDPHLAVDLGGHVPHARADHLQHGARLPSNEVELVHNEEVDVLHILPLLPPPGEDVPVLGSTDYDVALRENTHTQYTPRTQVHIVSIRRVPKHTL